MDGLNCHNCIFSKLQMNLKCKVIFNINIVNFLIILVILSFNKNHIKIYGCVIRK